MPALPSDNCVTSDTQILLSDPVILEELDLSVVTVCIPSAAPSPNLICLSQNFPCKNIQLESVLTTVDENGLCQIGVRNNSHLPVKLKSGMYLGNVSVLP